ncbi:hypothetical protein [Mycoplana ramosa]|uniref:Uncharacterized protein n=1 Tax=Mycoplana ramosa TaxID=40837 RepID=A0ABW3YY50_MYCRA
MRGHMSSDRRALRADAAIAASGAHPHASADMRVTSTLGGDYPVSDEELAVLEAFLMPALARLFDDGKLKPDSKQPQRPAIQDEDCIDTEIRS